MNGLNYKKLFFGSSSEVYGTPLYYPTNEKHPILLENTDNPRFSYNAAKSDR